jgi:hypothetical protein
MPMRLKIWETIAEMDARKLPKNYSKVIGLEGLKKEVDIILKGGQLGRVIVRHEAGT